MKRLRKKIGPIRFFMCGEYGDELGRPHYHAIIFGNDFSSDKVEHKLIKTGTLYKSALLEKEWTHGFCTVQDFNYKAAAYCARYVTKKIVGEKADAYYLDPETGVFRTPEYVTMSLRKGLGEQWFNKYQPGPIGDIYPADEIIIDGKKLRPPPYYDQLYRRTWPDEFEKIVEQRRQTALNDEVNQTPARLAVRETIHKGKLNRLPRTMGNPL